MSRFPVSWPQMVLLQAVFFSFSAFGQAESPKTDSPELREIRELRALIEQQGRQIEALSQQVGRLVQQSAHPAAAETREAAPAPTAAEVPVMRAEPVPKPADSANKHVVEKGETLTSIAKRFNISVSELQKINKIENDRKLQIGQTLIIPSPKSPEPDKKENP